MTQAYMRHARQAGCCAKGVRAFLDRAGIPLSEVTGPDAPGIDTERLRALGVRAARKIADIAEAEEAKRNG